MEEPLTLEKVAARAELNYSPDFVSAFAHMASEWGLKQVDSVAALGLCFELEPQLRGFFPRFDSLNFRDRLKPLGTQGAIATDMPCTEDLARAAQTIPKHFPNSRVLDPWHLAFAVLRFRPEHFSDRVDVYGDVNDTEKLEIHIRHSLPTEDRGGLKDYFDAPGEVERLGREISGSNFQSLALQLQAGEVLIGVYREVAPHGQSVAPLLVGPRAYEKYGHAHRSSPRTYYAVQRHIAGWQLSLSTRKALALAVERATSQSKDRVHVEVLLLALFDAKNGPTRRAFSDASYTREKVVQLLLDNGFTASAFLPELKPLATCPPISKHVGESLRIAAQAAVKGNADVIDETRLIRALFSLSSCRVPQLFPGVPTQLQLPELVHDGTPQLEEEGHWEPSDDGASALSGFTTDSASIERPDLLDVETEARAFAWLAANKKVRPPLSVAVFGEWGSGKSYFMNRMHHHLSRVDTVKIKDGHQSPFHTNVVQIRFNAWHYMETNLWASLVDEVFRSLDHYLRGGESKDKQAQEQLSQAVFEQLVTARRLKLEALEELSTRLLERQSAERALEAAKSTYDDAVAETLKQQPDLTSGAFWKAVSDQLLSNEQVKEKLPKMLEDLGIQGLLESGEGLRNAVRDARSEGRRTALVGGALLSKMGTMSFVVVLALATLLVPFLVTALKQFASSTDSTRWLKNVNDGLTWAATAIVGLSGWLARAVASGKKAVDRLQTFNEHLDAAINEVTTARTEQILAESKKASSELELATKHFEEAKRKLGAADVALSASEARYEDTTPYGRLSGFIRSKITDNEYAQHLGIIAAIRRDFGKLADLMHAADKDDQAERDEQERADTEIESWRVRIQDRLEKFDMSSSAGKRAISEKDFATVREKLEEGLASLEKKVQAEEATPDPRFSRIVLYIDDLDRCPPEKVVQVLQAIHLLLYFPLFVVVVAVDSRWVSKSLEEVHRNLLVDPSSQSKRTSSGGFDEPMESATSSDYLEKIFNIPYWVRPMSHKASEDFVRGMVRPKETKLAPETAQPKPSSSPGTRDGHVTSATSQPPSASPGSSSGATPNAPPPEEHTPSTSPPSEKVPPVNDTPEVPSAEVAEKAMDLSNVERHYLAQLGPFIGGTPRRAIRFVNVYRIIKASLEPKSQTMLVGKNEDSLAYRALMSQLAIVTGVPSLSAPYFRILRRHGNSHQTLDELIDKLTKDLSPGPSRRVATVRDVLELYRDSAASHGGRTYTDAQLIRELLTQAPHAQRYSFSPELSRRM